MWLAICQMVFPAKDLLHAGISCICLAELLNLASNSDFPQFLFASLNLAWIVGYQNSLHRLDVSMMTWTDLSQKVKGDIPPARQSMALVESGGYLYLFGGRSATGAIQ